MIIRIEIDPEEGATYSLEVNVPTGTGKVREMLGDLYTAADTLCTRVGIE